jgi:hypothetical protein
MKKSSVGREVLKNNSCENVDKLIRLYSSRFQLDDLLLGVELRRRFYSTLKGIYWNKYEKGQCFDSTALRLVFDCNKGLDKETEPMRLWEESQEIVYNERRIRLLKRFTDFPLIGKLFRRIVYDIIIRAYDVALAFVKAHYRAEEIMDSMEKDMEQDTYQDVMEEAHQQIIHCQNFIKENITDTYPDIVAEVQTKMACFLLINKQRKMVSKIYEQGVLKDQEFQGLMSSITENLTQLKFMSKPEIPTLESVLKKRFSNINKAEIKKVLPMISERRFRPDTKIFEETDKVLGAYLIFSGVVHEYGQMVNHELTKDNIVGAFHLIQGFQDCYMTTAVTRAVTIAAFIPLNALNDFFIEDIYKESAKQFVLYYKEHFGLKEAENAHIIKVVENSSVLHLYSGSPVNLRRGALVLKGRVRKDKDAFSLLRPSKKIIESLEDAVVLIFPPHFGEILRQHFLIRDAFASYFIKGPTKKVQNSIVDRQINVHSTFKINQLETTNGGSP